MFSVEVKMINSKYSALVKLQVGINGHRFITAGILDVGKY